MTDRDLWPCPDDHESFIESCFYCRGLEIERLQGEAEVADEQLAQLRGFAAAHANCRASDGAAHEPCAHLPNQAAWCPKCSAQPPLPAPVAWRKGVEPQYDYTDRSVSPSAQFS